jgi:NAD(P)-dependent dehydrogenase (short-subunit alcohol dehydrogenase family)
MAKSIFITGGASGMGRAGAKLFYERGWIVGAVDVNEGAGIRTTTARRFMATPCT